MARSIAHILSLGEQGARLLHPHPTAHRSRSFGNGQAMLCNAAFSSGVGLLTLSFQWQSHETPRKNGILGEEASELKWLEERMIWDLSHLFIFQ